MSLPRVGGFILPRTLSNVLTLLVIEAAVGVVLYSDVAKYTTIQRAVSDKTIFLLRSLDNV